MSWVVEYSNQVFNEDLPSLPKAIRNRILDAINSKLATHPDVFGKPLRFGLAGFRSLRVGDYRVLYFLDREKNSLTITKIDHRKDVYE